MCELVEAIVTVPLCTSLPTGSIRAAMRSHWARPWEASLSLTWIGSPPRIRSRAMKWRPGVVPTTSYRLMTERRKASR